MEFRTCANLNGSEPTAPIVQRPCLESDFGKPNRLIQ